MPRMYQNNSRIGFEEVFEEVYEGEIAVEGILLSEI